MKQLLLLMLTFPLFASAQYFTLTEQGMVNEKEPEKNYVVLSYPDVPAATLYNKVLLYLNKTYVSPKDVISKVENQSITVNGFAKDAVRRNSMHVFNMNYTVNIEFKDGKIRVAAPNFTLTAFYSKPQTLHVVADGDLGTNFGIWNMRHKMRAETAKSDLETFFNNYVKELDSALQAKADNW